MPNEYIQEKQNAQAATGGSSQSKSATNMEQELAAEKDRRREDRYIFFAILVCIFDAWGFSTAQTWTTPIVVGVLELVPLVILARRMGIAEIHFWLNRVTYMLCPQQGAPPEKKQQTEEKSN